MNIAHTPPPVELPSDQDATGRTLADAEIALIIEAVRSGTLTVTKGKFGRRFEAAFAALVGVPHATACSSGSAAVHAAVAAVDPEPGDEVITTSVTDMGALTPILYQGAIPVFADIDPASGNVTAKSIAKRVTPRTKAIIVTHLFGNPCDMTAVMAVARHFGLPVIEDCAQAFLATHRGRPVGTFGALGCFSLQQGKHITTGEGGVVVTERRGAGEARVSVRQQSLGVRRRGPGPYLPGPELPLHRVAGGVRRRPTAEAPRHRRGPPGNRRADDGAARQCRWASPRRRSPASSVHSYWKYPVLVDPAIIPGGPAGAGGGTQTRQRHERAAVHPKTRLPVRRVREPEDVRGEPVAVSARPPGRRRLLRRPVPRHVRVPRSGAGAAVERAVHRWAT